MNPNYVAKKSVVTVFSFWGIVSCILIVPIFILVFKILTIKKYKIEFYDDKIIVYSGLFNTSKKQCVFMGVTSTAVEQTLFGKIFNYGDVKVDCVGQWDIDTKSIKNPYELEKYLQSKIIQTPTNQFVHI